MFRDEQRVARLAEKLAFKLTGNITRYEPAKRIGAPLGRLKVVHDGQAIFEVRFESHYSDIKKHYLVVLAYKCNETYSFRQRRYTPKDIDDCFSKIDDLKKSLLIQNHVVQSSGDVEKFQITSKLKSILNRVWEFNSLSPDCISGLYVSKLESAICSGITSGVLDRSDSLVAKTQNGVEITISPQSYSMKIMNREIAARTAPEAAEKVGAMNEFLNTISSVGAHHPRLAPHSRPYAASMNS